MSNLVPMFLNQLKETFDVFVYPAEANDLRSVFLNFSGYLSSNGNVLIVLKTFV